MAVLTDSGRAAVAAAIISQNIHLAWGTGSESWDDSPVSETVDATELRNEIGRREASQAIFCEPNTEGGLIVPEGRFSPSATATKWIYLRFAFDFADAPSASIREVAVYLGTARKSGVPSQQEYLIPSEINDFGRLLVVEHIPRIDRSPAVRQQFEFVIQF